MKSLMIFIYKTFISISLVSKTSMQGIELCWSLSLPPSHCCAFDAVFALILFIRCAKRGPVLGYSKQAIA